MTVPFLSSMVTDSWLSFWRNLTSFIALPVPTPVRYFLPAVTDYPFGSTRAAVCVRSRWRASSRRTIRACPRGVVRVRSRSRRGAGVRLTRVLRLAFEAFRRVFTVSVPRLTGWRPRLIGTARSPVFLGCCPRARTTKSTKGREEGRARVVSGHPGWSDDRARGRIQGVDGRVHERKDGGRPAFAWAHRWLGESTQIARSTPGAHVGGAPAVQARPVRFLLRDVGRREVRHDDDGHVGPTVHRRTVVHPPSPHRSRDRVGTRGALRASQEHLLQRTTRGGRRHVRQHRAQATVPRKRRRGQVPPMQSPRHESLLGCLVRRRADGRARGDLALLRRARGRHGGGGLWRGDTRGHRRRRGRRRGPQCGLWVVQAAGHRPPRNLPRQRRI